MLTDVLVDMNNMKKVIITEKQLRGIIEESYYDSQKLYSKEHIENVTRSAPSNIKNIVRGLEVLGCTDRDGNTTQCVRIPEVLFVYITGRY